MALDQVKLAQLVTLMEANCQQFALKIKQKIKQTAQASPEDFFQTKIPTHQLNLNLFSRIVQIRLSLLDAIAGFTKGTAV